ncbi:hypothetical protein V1277_006273 [Bradyrhizobium sp. AZCC 1588]|uniref:hypothetical protein n=1 Tax=unclassified Bradyrhizobium TaxID=2631580 RepID=UPI002FEF1552
MIGQLEPTEQTRLLMQLNLMRRLLDGPTTMKPNIQKAARAVAENLSDRIQFNCGWHAAAPDRELPGSASAATIQAELTPLIDLLQARAKPARGRGRPTKDAIAGPDMLVIIEYLSDRTGKSLASIIDAGIRDKGCDLDKNKTTAAHVKRIERIIEKMKRAHLPKTNNVLIFRPKKAPRRKLPGK